MSDGDWYMATDMIPYTSIQEPDPSRFCGYGSLLYISKQYSQGMTLCASLYYQYDGSPLFVAYGQCDEISASTHLWILANVTCLD